MKKHEHAGTLRPSSIWNSGNLVPVVPMGVSSAHISAGPPIGGATSLGGCEVCLYLQFIQTKRDGLKSILLRALDGPDN